VNKQNFLNDLDKELTKYNIKDKDNILTYYDKLVTENNNDEDINNLNINDITKNLILEEALSNLNNKNNVSSYFKVLKVILTCLSIPVSIVCVLLIIIIMVIPVIILFCLYTVLFSIILASILMCLSCIFLAFNNVPIYTLFLISGISLIILGITLYLPKYLHIFSKYYFKKVINLISKLVRRTK